MLAGSAWAALSPEQQTRAENLKNTLRCPICTGEAISQSTNDISREMRAEVDRLVGEGQSDREIYDYFAARYSQFVLLNPPKQGANLLLWAGPLLALAAGGWWLLHTLKTRPEPAPLQTTEPPNTWPSPDPDLQPYLEQVQRDVAQRRRAQGQATQVREDGPA